MPSAPSPVRRCLTGRRHAALEVDNPGVARKEGGCGIRQLKPHCVGLALAEWEIMAKEKAHG